MPHTTLQSEGSGSLVAGMVVLNVTMSLKHVSAGLLALALTGGGLLWAQPGNSPATDDDDAAGSVADKGGAVQGSTDASELSQQEMTLEADRLIADIDTARSGVIEVQGAAREDKDMVRLNCVDDKLAQADELREIATVARSELAATVAAGDREGRLHQYSLITISHERAGAVREEANACIGEEMSFEGDNDIDVNDPGLDDPTKYAPFKLADSSLLDDAIDNPTEVPWDNGNVPIERPVYATPFR